VFLGADYENKDWCGVEFRAIGEIIKNRDDRHIMFVRTDDGKVTGKFNTDGYVDARNYNPMEISTFVIERLELLSQNDDVDSTEK